MLIQSTNELYCHLQVRTVSPLLIREGRFSPDKRDDLLKQADKETRKIVPHAIPISRNPDADVLKAVMDKRDPRLAVERLIFYVPGSSMRGAWRAHLERALRAIDPPDKPRVCDPLELDDKTGHGYSCSGALTGLNDDNDKRKDKVEFHPYSLSCPVCKLFGSTTQSSRIVISDGERARKDEGRIVARDHVAIDRHTGHVKNPFRFFGLQDAIFDVDIKIRNFELWHIRLLGSLMNDLSSEIVPLGSGKNKGYGRVKGALQRVALTWFGRKPEDDVLRGVAEHPDAGTADWYAKRYGITPAAHPPSLKSGKWEEDDAPWRHKRLLDTAEFLETSRKIELPWNSFKSLSQRKLPEAR